MSSYSNSFFNLSPILTEIMAAANSYLGILTVVFGATRAFPMTNDTYFPAFAFESQI